MKTAFDTYMEVQDIECPKVNNLTLPEDWQIKAMKTYAKKVAKRVLKDAAGNAKMEEDWVWDSEHENKEYIGIDKQSIISTPIITP